MSDNDREALDYMIETLGPDHPYSHPYWAVSTLAELRTYLDSRRNELTKVPRLKVNRTPAPDLPEKEGEAAPRSIAQTLDGTYRAMLSSIYCDSPMTG